MRRFGPTANKTWLSAHVLVSVGWAGSVAAFLAIAAAGASSEDVTVNTGIYLALDYVIWLVIVPLSGLSLITGVVQSVGGVWGLVKHYWVLAKLLLTVVATGLLLLHTDVVDTAAAMAAHEGMDFGPLRLQLVVDSAAGLGALILITVLAVVKPRGLTPWGNRAKRTPAAHGEAELSEAGE